MSKLSRRAFMKALGAIGLLGPSVARAENEPEKALTFSTETVDHDPKGLTVNGRWTYNLVREVRLTHLSPRTTVIDIELFLHLDDKVLPPWLGDTEARFKLRINDDETFSWHGAIDNYMVEQSYDSLPTLRVSLLTKHVEVYTGG